MIRILKENKLFIWFFMFVLLSSACFVMTSGMVASARTNSAGGTDYSLASISQAAAIYVNRASAPENVGAVEIPESISPGDAASAVGYFDADSEDDTSWIASRDSYNVVVWGYSNLANVRTRTQLTPFSPNNATSSHTPGFRDYGYFGYLLSYLGLDEVSVGASTTNFRIVIGVVTLCLYVLAMGMSTFFNFAINVLYVLNPFSMFAKASQVKGVETFNTSGGGVTGIIAQAFVNISVKVGGLYDTLSKASMFVILPVTFAAALFTWLVIRKGQNFLGAFKNFFLRLVFSAIGVSLLFACYSAILEKCKVAVKTANAPATQVIGSIFCDFEAWVDGYTPNGGGQDMSLYLPMQIGLDTKSMQADYDSVTAVRHICYAINRTFHPDTFGGFDVAANAGSLDGYVQYDKDMRGDKPELQIVGSLPDSASGFADISKVADVMSMLTRYAMGETISSAAYESNAIKGLLNKSNSEQAVVALFLVSDKWGNYAQGQAQTVTHDGNDAGSALAGGFQFKNSAVNINYSADKVASLAVERWKDGGTFPEGNLINIFTDGNLTGGGTDVVKFTSNSRALSSLGTYNYLNSQFLSTGVKVSSPVASSNDQVKYAHYSVNLVGHGVMKYIYLLDALALLASISVVGYGYALSILVANFKGMLKLIPAVFAGLLGSVRSIIMAIMLMFALIVEILVSFILFEVSIDIIFAVYEFIEEPLAKILGNVVGNSGGAGLLATALLGLISSVLILFLCKQMITWRGAIVAGITAAINQGLDKMFQVQTQAPSLGIDATSTAGKAARLGIAGVSIAAANGMTANGLIENSGISQLKDNAKASMSKIAGSFGAISGNGTGETSADVSSEVGYNETAAGVGSGGSGGSGAGSAGDSGGVTTVSGSARTEDEAAELAINEKEAGFTEQIDHDLSAPPASGESASDYLLSKYGNFVTTTDNEDGSVTEVKQTYDEATGTRVVESSTTGGGIKNSSKLVDTKSSSSYESEGTYRGEDGKIYSESSSVTTNKLTGEKIIHNETESEIVDENVSFDDAGNIIRDSTKNNKLTGAKTHSLASVNQSTGSMTVSTDVTDRAGVTIHSEERHKKLTDGTYDVSVITTDEQENIIGRSRSTCKASGSGMGGNLDAIVNGSSQRYDSSGTLIEKSITKTTNSKSGSTVQVSVQDVKSGITKLNTTHISSDGGRKTVIEEQRGLKAGGDRKQTTYIRENGGWSQQDVKVIRSSGTTTNVSYSDVMMHGGNSGSNGGGYRSNNERANYKPANIPSMPSGGNDTRDPRGRSLAKGF